MWSTRLPDPVLHMKSFVLSFKSTGRWWFLLLQSCIQSESGPEELPSRFSCKGNLSTKSLLTLSMFNTVFLQPISEMTTNVQQGVAGGWAQRKVGGRRPVHANMHRRLDWVVPPFPAAGDQPVTELWGLCWCCAVSHKRCFINRALGI